MSMAPQAVPSAEESVAQQAVPPADLVEQAVPSADAGGTGGQTTNTGKPTEADPIPVTFPASSGAVASTADQQRPDCEDTDQQRGVNSPRNNIIVHYSIPSGITY